MIETPARARDVSYALHLVDRIVADATTSEGALPLLEFALTELWIHQRRREVGHEAYAEIGEVRGSIGRRGEHAVGELLGCGVSKPDIERTLIALISSSSREDTPATRRSCPVDELDDTQRQVAETLTQARLLTATCRDDHACYELAHEVLIGSWKRLHQAAEADGEFLRWRTRLEQWRDEDGPLPEAWVAEGTHWCEQRDAVLPRLVRLVLLSQNELQRRLSELEAARDEARLATRRAEALRLAAQAQMELIRPAGVIAALALAAGSLGLEHTLAGDNAARAALRLAARPISTLAHDGGVTAVVFSPYGTWVATASRDGTARIFDPTTGTEHARLTHDRPVTAVVFSPDGTRVATASDDGTARSFAVRADELRDALTACMPRSLTDVEWLRYGGRPSKL